MSLLFKSLQKSSITFCIWIAVIFLRWLYKMYWTHVNPSETRIPYHKSQQWKTFPIGLYIWHILLSLQVALVWCVQKATPFLRCGMSVSARYKQTGSSSNSVQINKPHLVGAIIIFVSVVGMYITILSLCQNQCRPTTIFSLIEAPALIYGARLKGL